MGLNSIHQILFNAGILFSLALGVWAAVMATRNQSISGNFWGAVATFAILSGITLVLGIIMALMGLQPPRMVTYFLYMAWLVVIMPGLFTILRGRDDRSAAIAFAILCFFNAATAFSMTQRAVVGPWMPVA
ncbi:MAG: hypothetical protein UZ15_CFX003002736 [Chloroflexi bacterium OLB15]|nr:MAG: hypothetical protein UZ15_CFX003002736 [Chloroflexi bacterium OLB15]